MKYIESLDGPGEGIFQNNRIAQLKPNCPPFVTVCPGCNSQGAHLLTEDTTGRLFSQLVTTIGPSCPASCLLLLQEDVREKRIFSSAKTETERQAPAAFSRHSAHRTFLAGHEQNRGCGQPSNDWMEPSIQKSKNWTKRLLDGSRKDWTKAGMKLLLRPHGASDGLAGLFTQNFD